MCGDKGAVVYMWSLVADKRGMYLVSHDIEAELAWIEEHPDEAPRAIPGPLRSNRVPQDHTIHFAATNLLQDSWLVEPTIMHSPSWLDEGPNVVLTYFAVLDDGGKDVLDIWPDAFPLDVPALIAERGNPPTHGAASQPQVRWMDVLLHALRHLRLLMGGDVAVLGMDGEIAAKLTDDWKRHLLDITPALAGLYSAAHEGWE